MSDKLKNHPQSNPNVRDPYQDKKQKESEVEKVKREVSDKVHNIVHKK